MPEHLERVASADDTHTVHVEGRIDPEGHLLSMLGSSNFVPATEATRHPLNAKTPAVRIVHDGGRAERARVYINGVEAATATRVEVVLDANDRRPPRAWVEFNDVDLDITADQADAPLIVPGKRFWPVLLGLLLNAIPAGLAWWTWTLNGPLPDAVFTLCVIGGIVWTLGVLGAFVGYGRMMADESADAEPEYEREQ